MFKSYVQVLCSSLVFDVNQFRLNFRSTALFLCLASVQRIDQVKIVYVYFSQRCPLHVHWCAQLQGCCPCSLACLRTGQPFLRGPRRTLFESFTTELHQRQRLYWALSEVLKTSTLPSTPPETTPTPLRRPWPGTSAKFTNGLGEWNVQNSSTQILVQFFLET